MPHSKGLSNSSFTELNKSNSYRIDKYNNNNNNNNNNKFTFHFINGVKVNKFWRLRWTGHIAKTEESASALHMLIVEPTLDFYEALRVGVRILLEDILNI